MKTKNTRLQNALEVASIGVVVLMVVLVPLFWPGLPDRVPGHYNLAGEVDRWGSRYEALVCLIIGMGMYALITLVSRHPKWWNMAVEPHEANRTLLYSTTKSMILWLKLEVVLVFAYLTYTVLALREISPWFLPVVVAILAATLVYYIRKQVRIDRGTKREIRIDSEVTRLKKAFPVSKFWLVPPCGLALVSLLVAGFNHPGAGLLIAALCGFEVLSFCVGYGLSTRAKSKFYSSDAGVNMALNRLRVRQLTAFWVILAYGAAVCGVVCLAVIEGTGRGLSAPVLVVYFAHVALALVVYGCTRGKMTRRARELCKGRGL